MVYAASGWFRDYLISISTGKGPSCLEMLGKTTTEEEEGLTYITGSIKNNCNRKFSHVVVVFKFDRTPGPAQDLSGAIACAYSSDVEPDEIGRFKSALPVSRNSPYSPYNISVCTP